MTTKERFTRAFEHREVDRVPIVKKNGAYIFSSDHSIPHSVSLETYRKVVETVKRNGAY